MPIFCLLPVGDSGLRNSLDGWLYGSGFLSRRTCTFLARIGHVNSLVVFFCLPFFPSSLGTEGVLVLFSNVLEKIFIV
jgi:hypothetical protein